MSSELGQHFVWVAAPTPAMGQQLLPLLYGCRMAQLQYWYYQWLKWGERRGTPFLGPQEMALSVPGPHTHDFLGGTHVALRSLFKCAAFCGIFSCKEALRRGSSTQFRLSTPYSGICVGFANMFWCLGLCCVLSCCVLSSFSLWYYRGESTLTKSS